MANETHKKLKYTYQEINDLLSRAKHLPGNEEGDRIAADRELDNKISVNADAISSLKDGSTETIQSLDKKVISVASDLSALKDNSTTTISSIDSKLSELDKAIEEIDARSDVVDIVATYADLENYTKKLTKDDVVKVLKDETHSGWVSYFKVDKASKAGEIKDWTYIASIDQYELKTNHDTDCNSLINKISTETSNREEADNTLTTNLTNEINNRTSADTALGKRIDDEVTARKTTDSNLSSEITRAKAAETTLTDTVNTKVTANTSITAKNGATKVNYDAKGLITGSSTLSASDIPSLDTSKITSGTFADERIASADTWNNATTIIDLTGGL